MRKSIGYYPDRKSPYRVQVGNFSVYVATRDEAKRIMYFAERLLNGGRS